VLNRRLSVALLIVLAGTMMTCGVEDSAPSIVLISIDTLRADHLSSYGYERPTPHIDALAAAGVLFEEAHTVAPWTLPAHMTLMTGLFSSTHRVDNDGYMLEPELPTLAEALTRKGYRAAGFVAHHYLSASYGFDRGFGDGYVYRQYLNDAGKPAEAVRGDEVVGAASSYLENSKGDKRPYFLFVHLFDPHWRYAAPAPFAGRFSAGYNGSMDGTLGRMMPAIAAKRPLPEADLQQLIDLYDEEIAWVDHLVGQLVAKIRSLPGGERTVIVLTSDHGEEFQDHGSLGHSVTLYREQTHVPLIIVDPRSERKARRVRAAVRSVDLTPTIGRIAGLPEDDPFLLACEGDSLHTLVAGGEREPSELPVVIETTRYGHPRAAVIVGNDKAIAPMDYDFMGIQQTPDGPRRRAAASWRRSLELFDVARDPGERSASRIDPENAAIVLLRDWQERAWRGLQIAFRPEQGWRVRLSFPPGTTWFDEAWMEDGTQTLRIDIQDNQLELGGFPPGKTYRVGLPLFIEPEGHVLTLEGLAGQAVFLVGAEERTVGAGETLQLDLARDDLRAAGPLGVLADGRARIRARPRSARAEATIDPEAEELLRSLGYVGHLKRRKSSDHSGP